jgi:hypothetical protein
MLFGIPTLDSIVVPMPIHIYIPHLGGNILVLNQLLVSAIEK